MPLPSAISRDSQNSRLHTGARVNVVLLTYFRDIFHWGPSIKYVTLQGGRGSEKVWQFVRGEGGSRSCDVTLSVFSQFTIQCFIWYFIIHSCKKVNLYCSVTALMHVGHWIKYIARGSFWLPPFFLIFSWTWKNIYEKIGYPRGFNLRCLDGWTLGVDPSLKPPDFKSPLQGGNMVRD